MQFAGLDGDVLVFTRVREVLPEDRLSPDRSHTMRLDRGWVAIVLANGQEVWPPPSDLPVRPD